MTEHHKMATGTMEAAEIQLHNLNFIDCFYDVCFIVANLLLVFAN